MANKTATLKNQAGDNIYPNIVGDNRNAAIKDSTTIKHTLADNKISLDLDEAIKGKIDAALQKPTGLTKTKLVGVGASGQENIEIGDNLTLANGKLSAAGGSVSPTLNLLDMSTETPTVRTSITEEEKQNIEKGLYNSVLYFDSSLGEAAIYSMYFPENAIYIEGQFLFSLSNVVPTGESASIANFRVYSLEIGEKSADGTYLITIEHVFDAPFSDGLPVLDLSDYDSNTVLTDDEITAIEDYESRGAINIKLPRPFDSIPATLNKGFVVKKDGFNYKNSFIEIYSTPVPYVLNDTFPIIALFDMRYIITDDKKLEMEYVALPQKGLYAGDGFLVWDDKEDKMVWKKLSTILPTTIVKEAINNKVSITAEEFDKLASGNYDLIVITHNNGLFDRYFCGNVGAATASDGKPNMIEAYCSKITHPGTRYVQSGISLSFSKNNLTSDINQSLGVRNESKLFNKNVRTYGSLDGENLLPCTTADNGKVLSVVNGEAK